MNYIVDIIIESIIRSITYAITISVATSVRNSIRKSVSKQVLKKLEMYVGSNGEIDEEKINSLIKVQVYPLGAGWYNVSIQEDVFNILNMKIITEKNTDKMFKIIKQEITIKKLKAKMVGDAEQLAIISALQEGFK